MLVRDSSYKQKSKSQFENYESNRRYHLAASLALHADLQDAADAWEYFKVIIRGEHRAHSLDDRILG